MTDIRDEDAPGVGGAGIAPGPAGGERLAPRKHFKSHAPPWASGAGPTRALFLAFATLTLLLASLGSVGCGGDDAEAEQAEDLVAVEVNRSPTPTFNLNLAAVTPLDVTTSHRYGDQAKNQLAGGLTEAVQAGACDFAVYPTLIRHNSYAPEAELPPIIVPPCPLPPARPFIRPAPSQPDPSTCSPYEPECPARREAEYRERLRQWEEERDALAALYYAALDQYEARVQEIRSEALAAIDALRRRRLVPDALGTDLTGAWLKAADLLDAEKGRRRLLVLASTDGRREGWQSEGAPAFPAGTRTVIWFFECRERCQQLKSGLSQELGAAHAEGEVQFLSPAQSGVLRDILERWFR